MNAAVIWTVFGTDLKNTLRDRRTWLAMVVVPLLLIPALLIVGPSTIERQMSRFEETPPLVAVVGGEYAPDIVQFLEASGRVRIVHVDDVKLDDSEADLVLRLSPETADIAGGGTGRATIEYDAAEMLSEAASARLHQLIAAYSEGIVAQRLTALGLDPDVVRPLAVDVVNVAPQERVGGMFLSMIMPMMLAVWAVMGGMYAAIDAVAGEKERGTLEALLATPPDRRSVVAGKYLVVVVTSVVASAISIAGMYIAFLIKPEALLGEGSEAAVFTLPFANVALILGIALLLAGLFSALELAVSAFARTFREAQSYLSPLSLVVVLPAIFTQFLAPSEAPDFLFFLPMINAIFVFKELIMGDIHWPHLAATAVSSLAWISVGLRLAGSAFKKESILFRM